MNKVAIHVENLSKQYRIGEAQQRYRTIRDSLSSAATAPFRGIRSAFRRSSRASNNHIWALKDLSFEIKRGETVGVIGRNGAGKSTLLKVLSRITEPTSGYADVSGRVGSLLEVGTGFHHELTGRENIFLSGAIMGMKKVEINRKFDDIVTFAEIEKFIDTPVKHYSSGMYLRLAFAIAAHLEPEILLVDELLAVGDVTFQRKCLGKMEDVAAHGRTVLFVSHNLGVVKELCSTSIVLNNGQLDFRGSVVDGIARYSILLADQSHEEAAHGAGFNNVTINGKAAGFCQVKSGEPFFTETLLDLREDCIGGQIFLIVVNSFGDTVLHQRVDSSELGPTRLSAGRYRVRAKLPSLWLAPGVYALYYKFIQRNVAANRDRYQSERMFLDVTGQVNGIGRATLAPPLNWTLTSEEIESESFVEFFS